MKTKLLLMLLALNGVLLGTNSASASTVAPTENTHNIASLSQTISDLIDFDGHNLVELAINRALLAKDIKDSNTEDSNYSDRQPIINGKIANPNLRPKKDRPLINGIIRSPEPMINGTVIKDRPSKNPKPIVNGLIQYPHQK
jgi:hypothetical protein